MIYESQAQAGLALLLDSCLYMLESNASAPSSSARSEHRKFQCIRLQLMS